MPEIVVTVLAIAVLLVLVSLLMPMAERLAVPHTMLLAALGMGLGLAAVALTGTLGLGPANDILRGFRELGLSADAFLVLFLPPLLFTAGLTIDVRLLIDELAGVLVLAIVAVIVATVFVGTALTAVTEVKVVACFLLGAIVATTDPAAVLAIFRDIGTPRRLSILVEGESLLNDAAAIAIFSILLSMLIGFRPPDPGAAVLEFVEDFIGGIIFGYLLARLVCLFLPWLGNAPVAEITVTVALAYLSYIIGGPYLGFSGVVAVVGAALTFAVYGRTRLAPGSWEVLTQTWRQLDFWANSLIFVLAAMVMSQVLPDLRWFDLVLLLVVILAALAARGLVLFGLLPALSAVKLMQPVANGHKAVILWGGLRGAVTMALALSISERPLVGAEEERMIVVLATGFVLFTLFVRAPTLRPLMRLLKLDQLSPVERALRDRVMALSGETIREQIEGIAREYELDSGLAEQMAGQVRPAEHEDGADAPQTAMADETRLDVGLLTLANREKELYLQHFNERTISRSMTDLLIAQADRRLDQVKTTGVAGYEAATWQALRLALPFRLAQWLHRRFGWSRPLALQLADRFESLLIKKLVVHELIKFNRASIRPMLGQDTMKALAGILEDRLAAIEDALGAVELQFPSYAEALKAQQLARAALRVESAEYRLKYGESLISREVFADLMSDLRTRRAALEHRPPLDLGLNLMDMIQRVGAFASLDQAGLGAIGRLLRPYLAMPGERIVSKGMRGRAMYFITSGQVEVRLESGTVRLGPGEFFGELALLTRGPRTADVVALDYCHLLVLEARDFHRLMRTNPTLRDEIKRVADERMATSTGTALD